MNKNYILIIFESANLIKQHRSSHDGNLIFERSKIGAKNEREDR